MSGEALLDAIKWDDRGLVTAVTQDAESGEVLMVAYMNRESLRRTLAEGRVCYYSRSRRKLWVTAEADGAGTLLKVGGFALQRRSQFEEEFSRLVRELERVPEGRVRS